MAITRIDTEVYTSSSASGSTSITVPSDCTVAILCISAYHAYDETFDYVRINSVDMTNVISCKPSNDYRFTYIYRLSNPSTGSQTFSWSYPYSVYNGFIYNFVYYKGIDTDSPVRNSASDYGTNPDCDVTTQSGDLVIGIIDGNGGTDPTSAPGGSGQTEIIDNPSFNGLEDSVGEETAAGSSVNFIGTGGSESTLCACSLIPAAGGGTDLSININECYPY